MQAPFWSQGLNRYSYVFNNPINFTDPSGFVAEGLGYFASNPSFAGDASSSLGGSVALGIAGGTAFAAGNIATSLLTGQYDLFDAHAGSTHSGVVIEGGEIGGRLLFNLLRKLIPRALEGSIEVTEKGLAHVLARHIIGGVEVTTQKSVFAPGTNIREIVKAAEAVKPVFQQASGNYSRIVDAGRVIGTTFEGQATHLYTVITDATNKLVTAFPGVPK